MTLATSLAFSALFFGIVAAAADPPIACNVNAISAEQRPRYADLTKRLRVAVRSRNDLEDGYRYKLDTKGISLPEIAEWISLERLCCPFLAFRLEVNGQGDTRLGLSGPNGTKAVLDGELPKLAK